VTEPISLLSEKELLEYIHAFMKKHGIHVDDIAKLLGLHWTNASRLLNEDFNEEGIKVKRQVSYSEAFEIIKYFLSSTSPFPEGNIKTIYTPSNCVNSEGTIFSEDTIETAAQKMVDKDFSQLIVKDGKTYEYIGIVTDYSVFKEMLSPLEVSKDWLRTLKDKKVSSLVDRPPKFNTNSKFIEVAQGLMHHYSVLIEEDNGGIGIITRWDFLKLIKKETL
jgi:predicted transcriptional regulator